MNGVIFLAKREATKATPIKVWGFILLSLFCLVGFLSPSVLYAIEYGGLGIYPNATEVDASNALTKAWFIYTLGPGEIKKGKVDVINTSVESVVAKVYPVDAVTTTDGAFAPEPEDREKTGVGSWVTLAASEVFLQPRETKTIDFTVSVPDIVDVGDHMGAIIVQNKKPSDDPAGSGLSITTRVGVRMYITVPGEIVRRLAFNAFIEEVEDGRVTLFPSLSNEGNVRVQAKGEIEIIDRAGETVAILPIPEREVFPREKITIPILWDAAVSPGSFIARALVEYDGGQTLIRELGFVIPSSGVALWVTLVAGALIVLLGGGLFVVSRRKRNKQKLE